MNNSQYEEKLWQRWQQQQSESVTNDLIHFYMHVVDYHVDRVAQHIPASFDRADLKSLAIMGLYDAMSKFDPSRNVKFATYASIRVHGSIMDGLRKEDWLPRSLRDRANKIERTSEELEQQLNRTPTAEDIAQELGISVAEVEATISDALFAKVQSLDTQFQSADADEPATPLSFIQDDKTLSPTDHILTSDRKNDLIQSIRQLQENEQYVISLVYMEELSLTEVGEVLNLTTSRISQIHKAAIFKLRKILDKSST